MTVWPATAAPSWPISPTARTAVVATSTGPAGEPPASSGVAQPAGGGVAAAGFFAPGRLAASARLAFRLAGAPACAAAFVDAAAFGSAFAREEVPFAEEAFPREGADAFAEEEDDFAEEEDAFADEVFAREPADAFAEDPFAEDVFAEEAFEDEAFEEDALPFADAVFALGAAFSARGFAVSVAAAATDSAASFVVAASPAGLPRLALRRVGRDRGRLERTSRWGSSAIGPSILPQVAAQGPAARCVD